MKMKSTLIFAAIAALTGGAGGIGILPTPNQFLTLLDVMKRTGASDSAIGLIEANQAIAPELGVIGGNTIRGLTYKLRIRATLGAGSFRSANEGVATTKNTYREAIAECMLYDAQMRADKAVADADERGAAVLLAEEAQGVTRGSLLALGRQVYYGTAADSKGFQGFVEAVDSGMVLSAGGDTAATCSSAWLAYVASDGVSFRWGNGGKVIMPDSWSMQQVTAPLNTDNTKDGVMTAYVNGMTAWMGLQVPLTTQLARICNIDYDHPVTDILISDALSKFPLLYRPNRLFMTPTSVSRLQAWRQANGLGVITISPQNQSVASRPTESNGIQITETNSISDVEAVVA